MLKTSLVLRAARSAYCGRLANYDPPASANAMHEIVESFERAYASCGRMSIGKWNDEEADGRYDVLEVESRKFKGQRNFEARYPLHAAG
jgi:hypothetical protein